MEKKSNKGLIIAIVILVLLLVGVSGYLVYDKVLSSDELKEGQAEEKVEERVDIVVTQAEIDAMMEVVEFNPDEVTNVDGFNALDNQTKLWMGLSLIDNVDKSFKGNDLIEALKNVYGDKVELTLEDMICGGCDQKYWLYNKDTGMYTFDEKHPGHGGTGGDYVKSVNYFDSVQTDGNQYKVAVKKVFKAGTECDLGPCDGNFKVYKSLDDAKNSKNLVLDTKEKVNNNKYCVGYDDEMLQSLTKECDINRIYQDNKDKFDSYIYTFIKNGDNFVFQSYELNK